MSLLIVSNNLHKTCMKPVSSREWLKNITQKALLVLDANLKSKTVWICVPT